MSTNVAAPLLEVCVDSLESALAAKRGGADRLELCANLVIGGTTPSVSLVKAVKRETGLPVHALLRPRFGDFLYTEAEFALMLEDAERLINAGADGIVSGCLTAEGALDRSRTEALAKLAHGAGKRFTLHRAFDMCADPLEALRLCRELGVDTILTSGQAGTCLEGKVLIKELCKHAGLVEILIGAGVDAGVIRRLRGEIPQVMSFHMSGKTVLESGMTYRKQGVSMGLPGLSEYELWRTDEAKIAEARRALLESAALQEDEDARQYLALCGTELWPLRRAQLAERGEQEAADRALGECNSRERELLCFLLASLPITDVLGCGPELLLSAVREALKAREEFPWYGHLPERVFLLDVLCPRVYDEELSDCRGLFRRELAPRVKGLSAGEAILEVNRWCAEHVTYRSTDDYTDSALRVYLQGYGRCGEESVFAVTALRSVGIAARQVYVPWWSHCDDNHAWVEAWDGERWVFFGACEPEPVPNRGWFTSAAARAMLAHRHAFAAGSPDQQRLLFPGGSRADGCLGRENGVICQELPGRYDRGRACPVTVKIEDENGRPAAGAEVLFQVLNMGEFRTIAARETGADGTACLTLGRGSVWISAEKDGARAEALAEVSPTAGGNVTVLRLAREEDRGEESVDLVFRAPEDDCEAQAEPLTEAQKAERRKVLANCAALREAWAADKAKPAPPARNGSALPLAGREALEPGGDCVLALSAPKDRAAVFGQEYSLAVLRQGRYCPVRLDDLPAGGCKEFALPEGTYRLTATVRLPGGDQLARCRRFSLAGGETRRMELTFCRAEAADLLERLPLPEFSLRDGGGTERTGKELLAGADCSLLVFLEPGREPTEHILNELRDVGEALCGTGCKVLPVLESPAGLEDPALKRALAALPGAEALYGEFSETADPLARRVYGDPDRLPLLLLADRNGDCRYSVCGYNVGTGALLLRLLKALGKERQGE